MTETIVISTPEQIAAYRALALRKALELEMKGLRHSRGVSALRLIELAYGLRGNRDKVYRKFTRLLIEKGILITPLASGVFDGRSRIVLHESHKQGEWVTHVQNTETKGYDWGHYFADFSHGASFYQLAVKDYIARCARYGVDSGI